MCTRKNPVRVTVYFFCLVNRFIIIVVVIVVIIIVIIFITIITVIIIIITIITIITIIMSNIVFFLFVVSF